MYDQKSEADEVPKQPVVESTNNKYKNIINSISTSSNNIVEDDSLTIDKLLEMEKQHNKNEQWNKLDKTVKIQKLHHFAEKYGKEHTLPSKDIKSLKAFFVSSLENNKLQKTKDVVYDKGTKEITAIPALHFNQVSRNFTLRITDAKRVSTLKSLTPKRITEKNTTSNDITGTNENNDDIVKN
jgi:hypothetical protein